MTARKLLIIYAVMGTIVMIGAFTLTLWAYIVLVCVCFIAMRVGRALDTTTNGKHRKEEDDQDSCDGVS